MGPQWFFEGFAVHGAGQEILAEVPPGPVADQIAWAEGAQEHAYSRFGGLVASLAARIPLPELVAHAGQADFLDWLQERLER
ncbi:MAG: hypothetical protein R3F62_29760 [Planctomycetota bacterium]